MTAIKGLYKNLKLIITEEPPASYHRPLSPARLQAKRFS